MSSPPTDACPFCDEPTDGERDLRFHLMANHRKSEFVDHLLEEPGAADSATIPV